MQPPGEADYPVEIRGFVTDPKAVGFQVLTNYESTYVRAYVGNDAWGLYEVLRSFCHDGNNTCHPSINLLLSILGIKQRRVLTGWTTTVKGKQYTYPGLIEILQQAELLIAEMNDEGPNQRYIFHVNLTPGMLTPQQVATLPPLMQTKHAELIQRHLDTLADLDRKRRPPKVRPDTDPAPQDSLLIQEDSPNSNGGSGSDKLSDPMTNCRAGTDNLSQPPDKLSPEQQPINKTHKTAPRASRSINNNNGDVQNGSNRHDKIHKHTEIHTNGDATQADSQNVVVALIEKGMAEKVATRLGARYTSERIREKIDFLTYVLEEDPGRIKNPRGWLRRAIEENYGPPDGYAPPEARASRAARAAEERRRQYVPDEYLPYLANSAAQPVAAEPAEPEADGDDESAAADAADDPMAVDMTPSPRPQHSSLPAAGAPGSLTRAARRTRLRQDYGVTDAAQSFWETALHDLRYTTTPDFFALVADAEIVALSQGAIHLAVWDEETYRQLQHPGLQKALSRDLSILAQRRLQVTVEWWQDGAETDRGVCPVEDC